MTLIRKARPRLRRRLSAVFLGTAVLWLVTVTAASPTAKSALSALQQESSLALKLLQSQLGDDDSRLPGPAELVISQSPLLTGSREEVALLRRNRETDRAMPQQQHRPPPPPEEPIPETPMPSPEALVIPDNGVPARTFSPSSPEGYLCLGNVYIRNTSDKAFDLSLFDAPTVAFAETDQPQVLIYHTHTTEAYTPIPGQSYESTGECRTLDNSCNVVRVGEELAGALRREGIGVIHDSTLHDWPEYNGSYGRSLTTAEQLLEDNPSVALVIDLHRDAIADSEGNPFKAVADVSGVRAAQISIVIGTDGSGLEHPRWAENLRLAAAIQQKAEEEFPSLMRPILVRNSRYNQHLSPGALLVEMGAAGNSLEEALFSARLLGSVIAEVMG